MPKSAAESTKLARVPVEVWRVCGVLVIGAFMSNLDTSLVNVGLNTIGRDLHAPLSTTQWVTNGYLLALAGALPVCGWLSRRYGAGRVWLWSLVAFTIASALCAAAPSIGILIALRVIQGICGGLLTPAGQTIMGQAAGPQRMGRVMNAIGPAVVLAPAIGPALGGVLITQLSWQWLFLINVPIGLIALLLGVRLVPLGACETAGAFDTIGFVLIGGGLPLVSYGITEVAGPDGMNSATYLALGAGTAAIAAFVIRSLQTRSPLMDLRLFGNRVYTSAQVSVFFTGAALFGGMILFPLYFEVARGQTVLTTGLLMISYGVGAAAAMTIGGRLTDRLGGGIVSIIGLTITTATTIPFAVLDQNASMALIQGLMLTRGIGLGLSGLPAMSAAYATVLKTKLPDATSQANILRRVGGALGGALFIVILDAHTPTTIESFHATFL